MNVLINGKWLKQVKDDRVIYTNNKNEAMFFETKHDAELFVKAVIGFSDNQFTVK